MSAGGILYAPEANKQMVSALSGRRAGSVLSDNLVVWVGRILQLRT